MSIQDWHAHAEQVAAPTTPVAASVSDTAASSVVYTDLAADLAALTRVLLGVSTRPTPALPAEPAFEFAQPPLVEPESFFGQPVYEEPAFVAPVLIEVPPLVEEAAPAAPAHRNRVSASDLIDELGFLDV